MELRTFYKLNDEEKNNLREESPLEKEVKFLSQRNAELELQMKILKGKKRIAEDKSENFRKENETLRYDISQYKLNNSSLHSLIEKTKNSFETLQKEYDLNSEKMKNEIEMLKSETKKLKEKNDSLEYKISLYIKENSDLQSEAENLRKENETFKYNISQYNVNNTALHARINRMKEEIENLKKESGVNNNKKRGFFGEKNPCKVGDKLNLGGCNWTVIETEQKRNLILCDEIVTSNIFQSSIPFSTPNWKNSTIRKWLNSEFFNAFSNSDKEKIIVTEHENVNDKIFLLGKSEFIRTRKNIFNVNKEWWLRPSGTGFIEYYSVDSSMNIRVDGEKSDEKAVRPALYIRNDF